MLTRNDILINLINDYYENRDFMTESAYNTLEKIADIEAKKIIIKKKNFK